MGESCFYHKEMDDTHSDKGENAMDEEIDSLAKNKN